MLIYDINGELENILGLNQDVSYVSESPWHIGVSRSGDKIFVSDFLNSTVICVTADGEVVYQYTDDEV